MSICEQSLGRETPFQTDWTGCGNTLIVSCRDSVSAYNLVNDKAELENQWLSPCTATCLLEDKSEWNAVVSTGAKLTLLTDKLEAVSSVPVSGDEIIKLVSLSNRTFLSFSEDFQVTCWDTNEQLQAVGSWAVECLPLAVLKNGKTVLSSENGRLQERDARNGMILKTWPKSKSICWAALQHEVEQGIFVDESGVASCWDLSAREMLFPLQTDFAVSRALFNLHGLGGALLGSEGEVCRFRLTEGGRTEQIEVPHTTLVSISDCEQRLIGLDENGFLWSLDQEPKKLGGQWGGWATSSLYSEPTGHLVGTAEGRLEFFDRSGNQIGEGIQVHRDAVVGLELLNESVLSLGADATIYRIDNLSQDSPETTEVAAFPGQSLVSYCLDSESLVLWVALEEGLIYRLDLKNESEPQEYQLQGYRIEELRVASPGSAYALTDRGSVKHLSP